MKMILPKLLFFLKAKNAFVRLPFSPSLRIEDLAESFSHVSLAAPIVHRSD